MNERSYLMKSCGKGNSWKGIQRIPGISLIPVQYVQCMPYSYEHRVKARHCFFKELFTTCAGWCTESCKTMWTQLKLWPHSLQSINQFNANKFTLWESKCKSCSWLWSGVDTGTVICMPHQHVRGQW